MEYFIFSHIVSCTNFIEYITQTLILVLVLIDLGYANKINRLLRLY